MNLIYPSLAVLCAAAGIVLLHRAWTKRGDGGLVLRGWLLMALSVAPWRASGAAWDTSIAFAILTPALIAFCVLAYEAEFRPGRIKTRPAKDVAPAELSPAAGPMWRGLARTALAGPLAGLAGLALSAFVALRAPLGDADRLVAAWFILPLAWAVGGVWATTDARLARVCTGLILISAIGFGAARL